MVKSRKFRSDEALENLRSDISSGKYKPGTFLPAERKLTELLNISRGTVRSIIKILQKESLIRINPGRGAYVIDKNIKGGLGRFVVYIGTTIGPIGDASENVRLLLGACRGAAKIHAEAIVSFTRPDDFINEIISRFASGDIQGVIYSDCEDYKKFILPLEKAAIPYIVANLEFDTPALAAKMDFRAVGRIAGRHLIELGHRNIGVLAGAMNKFIYKEMLAGFRGALAEDEVVIEPRNIIEVPSETEPSRVAALKMLSAKNRPTAIFTTRDIRAAGCYLACRELCIKIPDDLSIISYDDITWPEAASSGLTSVKEPIEEMAMASVEMIDEWIRTGKKPQTRSFPGELLVRSSTRRLQA